MRRLTVPIAPALEREQSGVRPWSIMAFRVVVGAVG
jgi:hypothetical protein